MVNVIVGIRLDARWEVNVNKTGWCIKWKYIVIRVIIEIKRYTLGRRKGNLKLGTITIKWVSPTRSIGIVLCYLWEVKDNKGIDPILKWEVIKKCHKYRAGDRDCLLCMEEKLAIASCKSRDMLNQRSEVLNSCRHKRAWLLYN